MKKLQINNLTNIRNINVCYLGDTIHLSIFHRNRKFVDATNDLFVYWHMIDDDFSTYILRNCGATTDGIVIKSELSKTNIDDTNLSHPNNYMILEVWIITNSTKTSKFWNLNITGSTRFLTSIASFNIFENDFT